MWGDDVLGNSFAAEGLGLAGIGEGGGGAAQKPLDLQGLASALVDANAKGKNHVAAGPHAEHVRVNGRLPEEVVSRIVAVNMGRFRTCAALRTAPRSAARVVVKATLARDGSVAVAADGGSTTPDQTLVACVVRAFQGLAFPAIERGSVTLTVPIAFTGEDDLAPTVVPVTHVSIAVIGHAPRPCGPAAELPLDERRVLWSERLNMVPDGVAGNAGAAANATHAVYRKALEDCEAPTWRERTTLLLAMVDHLRTVAARVALWRSLILTPAADEVYRAILVRVQSVGELHELHQALGLRTVDPELLGAMVAKAKSPAERLGILRAAATKWPDDLELGLRVLDAFEDASDDGGGRAWARRLRRRADATAHVWASVGEYYLRRARGESGDDAERDKTEGRRTFGELVEFAPEDPAARRRLGDLLRAHGWYEEALRQYLTLQALTPDDPAVPLLLAAAAQGLGRVEEAVGWAEKAAAAGSPDGKSPLTRAARATALAFVAWAAEDAARAGKKDDAERLLGRARRLVAAGSSPKGASADHAVTFLITWSHPELHPSLWTNALGAPMPSPDNFPSFGVATTQMTDGPATVELRLEPEDAARAARLGATATVTAITGAGTAAQKSTRREVLFGTLDAPVARMVATYTGGALRVEAAQ
jgi:Ca-activated chloride channel family protein